MKAVISTTYDDKYLFFLPICVWAWGKLGVDVICFLPNIPKYETNDDSLFAVTDKKFALVCNTIFENGNDKTTIAHFDAPEHKQATYAQCSRLYGACLDLPEEEILVTSDIDMAVFKIPPCGGTSMGVFGIDLVPKGQIPICYIMGSVKEWRNRFEINGRTYQQCLDDLLGEIEAEHFRGNFWSKDQEEAYNKILGKVEQHAVLLPRSNGQNQFATKRLDRDDAYILERQTIDVIDYHMNRPGYEHIETILSIFGKIYPDDNFDWILEYTNAYKQLL